MTQSKENIKLNKEINSIYADLIKCANIISTSFYFKVVIIYFFSKRTTDEFKNMQVYA